MCVGNSPNLRRKSVEPIALRASVAPRTLQKFLAWAKWDHGKLRDRVQQIVASEHCTGEGVLIVDETSHKKKGDKTPGVQRQHCGSTGKIDNCVVTVHIAYSEPTSGFRTLLDSDLFLPEHGWDDAARRAAAPSGSTICAGIPTRSTASRGSSVTSRRPRRGPSFGSIARAHSGCIAMVGFAARTC